MSFSSKLLLFVVTLSIFAVSVFRPVLAETPTIKPTVGTLVQSTCLDCHTGKDADAGFDLSKLLADELNSETLAAWIKVHERVEAKEMPPDDLLADVHRDQLLRDLTPSLIAVDRALINQEGRSIWRRMNRYEYENSLRDLLAAPWLQIKTILPEDGELQRFNKVGEALDVSHVNLARYMQAADYALRQVLSLQNDAPKPKLKRFYAREQGAFNRKVHYNPFNRSPERATFPLIGYDADVEMLRDEKKPFTVGDADPELREKEAFGVVASSYEPIELRFNAFKAPTSGRYKLRFRGYTFWAAGEEKRPWRPDREKTSIGRRSEPVAVYAVSPPRQLRWLGQFDFQIEPTVQELDVYLLEGESIQPDAVRLFRSRPPNWHNPLAEADGMPGVAFNYLETEGPIFDAWPTEGHKLLFGDLPVKQVNGKREVVSKTPIQDAEKLLNGFLPKAFRRELQTDELKLYLDVVQKALDANFTFQEAMISGYTAALCSPGAVCLEEQSGRLSDRALATRLSLFLWNTTPDAELLNLATTGQLRQQEVLRKQARRLLEDSRSQRFIEAFLAYWLDLRKINDTSPDELLYPDYYLDDHLVDSALQETQMFFADVVGENLSAKNLVDADFTYVNERLAKHYELPLFEGALLRKVLLPPENPRGGLLTQASVLKVTANGTTTSPVVRGAWINERILGNRIPPPPKSVPAIEPDTRGATTIREQLDRHRADPSCAGCHAKIDPVGFALESFDVAGGFRQYYRSLGDAGEKYEGYGKNGQPFTFRKGPPVDASGNLESGETFNDIFELKKLLVQQDRAIARNLIKQLLVYSTGAPTRFSDRVEIEAILDKLATDKYPVRSIIEEVVCSDLFMSK